jgi:stress response protein YsnF
VLENDQIDQVIGSEVVGPDGQRIGHARQVFVDDETGRAKWVSVETGLLGNRASFIPLRDAAVSGNQLSVPYDKARVKGAPDHLGEGDHLSPDDEEQLERYYSEGGVRGDDVGDGGRGQADIAGDRADGTDETRDVAAVGAGADDDAMTVSEEQLAVSTRSVARERVRLRKHVVTEEITMTVTVRKERFTVEREPISEDSAADYTGGTDFGDSDTEIILHEEVPVVQKVVRPVERVRLTTGVDVRDETVGGEVRKERVELENLPLEGERGV